MIEMTDKEYIKHLQDAATVAFNDRMAIIAELRDKAERLEEGLKRCQLFNITLSQTLGILHRFISEMLTFGGKYPELEGAILLDAQRHLIMIEDTLKFIEEGEK